MSRSAIAGHKGAEGSQTDVPRDWLPGEKLGVGIQAPMAPARPAFLIIIPLGLAHHSKSDTTTTLTYARQELMPHPNPQEKVQANKWHKSGCMSCQDPGSKLTMGSHLPALASVFSSVKWV